ncbi:MAG: hypothetical protein QOF44_6042 [Streptomyces sp.]|jgi:hypothetical protein|nr:hypothetical protein [Streptomyces sp.]
MVRPCHAPTGCPSLRWGGEEEVVHVRLSPGSQAVLDQDYVALAEIELCGELMIAASAADEERLSSARIDEVLRVEHVPSGAAGR